jgi:prepilin-type N-terminal cleavage/methylation domain-containing protein
MKQHLNHLAFTLSELLVSLSVLGLIAAFAVPKVLNAVSDHATKATGKEAIGMITAAYDSLKADKQGVLGTSTTAETVTTFMNYSEKNVVSATETELILHSGASIAYDPNDSFTYGGTGLTGAIRFNIDPNGPGASGPGAVSINLGHDGKLWEHDLSYGAGTGSTPNPHTASYDLGTTIATATPSNAEGTDTTWLLWSKP